MLLLVKSFVIQIRLKFDLYTEEDNKNDVHNKIENINNVVYLK